MATTVATSAKNCLFDKPAAGAKNISAAFSKVIGFVKKFVLKNSKINENKVNETVNIKAGLIKSFLN